MALNQVLPMPGKQKKGGGLFGQIAGAVVGGIVGLEAGGGNPAMALKGAQIGQGVGGMVGGAVSPAGVKESKRIPLNTASQQMPEMDFMALKEAQKDLLTSNELQMSQPEREQLNASLFEPAMLALKKRMEAGRA